MADVPAGSLEGIEVLCDLSREAREELAARCVWLHFSSGDDIIAEGTDSTDFYFLVAGHVRVFTFSRDIPQDDREVSLASVTEGGHFGELAAVDGRGRSARVVAMEECTVARLSRQALYDALIDYPTICIRLLEQMVRIVRRMDTRITELSTLSDSQRVLCELLRIAEPDGREGYAIPTMPSHKDIASWAGTTREVVAQTIGELARDGVVARRTNGLVIRDWSRMQLMARVPEAVLR